MVEREPNSFSQLSVLSLLGHQRHEDFSIHLATGGAQIGEAAVGKQQVLQSPVLTVTAVESKALGVSLPVICSGCGSDTGEKKSKEA